MLRIKTGFKKVTLGVLLFAIFLICVTVVAIISASKEASSAEINTCLTKVSEDQKVISFSFEGKGCVLPIQVLDEDDYQYHFTSKKSISHILHFSKNGTRQKVVLKSPNSEMKGNVYRCPKREYGWWIRWHKTSGFGAMDACMSVKRL